MLRVSRFVVSEPVGHNKIALYSTLSKAFVLLEKERWDRLLRDLADDRSPEDISALEELGIVVPADTDELLLYRYWAQKLKYYFGRLIFTILPTLQCNMSCVYCLQTVERERVASAAKCDAQGIASFVRRYVENYVPQELIICHFGGEPLLGFDSLVEMVRAIQAILPSSTTFKQTVITNGLLLSQYACALREANVGTAQVTLDGLPWLHDQRRPVSNGQGSFDSIIRGVRDAMEEGIFVNLPITLDGQNADSVGELMEIVKNEFGTDSPLAVNISQVTQPNWECPHASKFVETPSDMGRIRGEAIEAIVASGLKVGDFLINNPCPLECDYELVIAPDGQVYKCLSGIGESDFHVGSIADVPWLMHRSMAGFVGWEPPLEGPCSECIYLPECRGGCRFRAWINTGDLA